MMLSNGNLLVIERLDIENHQVLVRQDIQTISLGRATPSYMQPGRPAAFESTDFHCPIHKLPHDLPQLLAIQSTLHTGAYSLHRNNRSGLAPLPTLIATENGTITEPYYLAVVSATTHTPFHHLGFLHCFKWDESIRDIPTKDKIAKEHVNINFGLV